MKKLVFIILIFTMFTFCSCSKVSEKNETIITPNIIASVIESNTKIQNLSDETIKALSVIVRTNLKNGYTFNNESYKEPSERIIKLAKQTDYEFLTDETNQNQYISFGQKNSKQTFWKQEIKKSEILKFLTNQKISIASLSRIEPEVNEQGETESLIVGGKKIKFETLKNEFNLKSNKISNIEILTNSVIITGLTECKEFDFNIIDAENESKKGADYKILIKNQLKNWYF